jgi:hypothetical protein
MTYDITHLCAGCGREIENDSFGLCAECEEHIQQADSAWKKTDPIEQADCRDTARRAPTPTNQPKDTE